MYLQKTPLNYRVTQNQLYNVMYNVMPLTLLLWILWHDSCALLYAQCVWEKCTRRTLDNIYSISVLVQYSPSPVCLIANVIIYYYIVLMKWAFVKRIPLFGRDTSNWSEYLLGQFSMKTARVGSSSRPVSVACITHTDRGLRCKLEQ